MAKLRMQQVAWEIQDARRRIRKKWYKHPTLMRFLEDHCPGEWEDIKQCKAGFYRTDRDNLSEDAFRAYSTHACHKVPWCIVCTEDEARRRVRAVRRSFVRCTPLGQEPRLNHVVVKAMIRKDGTGWGNQARKDIDSFYNGAHELMRWAYGERVGWYGAYHDIGNEQALRKGNPHIDLCVNGWTMGDDGAAAQVKDYDVTGKGHERFCRKQEQVFYKRFGLDVVVTNLHFDWFRPGIANRLRLLQYQHREIVDVTKVRYNREAQKVYWVNEKDASRVEFKPIELLASIAEYGVRLGQWGYEPERELHRAMGAMSKGNIRQTQKAMGSVEEKHPTNCACHDCGEWERVWLDGVQDFEDMTPLVVP